MNLLIVAATPFEILPFQSHLKQHFEEKEEGVFEKEDLRIQILVTGVGQMFTAFALGTVLSQSSFDLLINAGVAGAFDKKLELGSVVNVISEQFGDLGAEDKDGRLLDVHDLDLIESNQFPFQNGQLINENATQFDFLAKVKGLTVNKVHGSSDSISRIQEKYEVAVESMEGAAFFYAALMSELPFLEIRAISNYVEVRNRENWKLGLAIENLNVVLAEFIQILQE